MRRARPGPDRIVSTIYIRGYAYNRNGAVAFCVGRVRRTIDRRWPTTAEGRATIAAMLDEWLREPTRADASEAIPGEAPRTVAGLAAAWADGPGASASPSIRRHMAGGLRLLPKGASLDVPTLVVTISKALATTTLAPSTAYTRAKLLKRLFAWGMAMGWLTRNPMTLVDAKPPKRSGDVGYFTLEDTERLCAYMIERDQVLASRPGLRRDHKMSRYALLFRWQFYTGMRISETLALKWSHVFADEIRIFDSKGIDVRYFPVAAIPHVQSMLDELRAQRIDASDGARLFHWWNQSNGDITIGTQLRKAMHALGMSRREPRRTLHTFRASAERYMEDELGLSPVLVVQITGHSLAVHVSNYRTRRRGKDLARQIDRESKGQA